MTILIVSINKIILILFENNLNQIQYFILIVTWFITNKERYLFIFGDNTSVHSSPINHQFGMKQLLIARSALLKLCPLTKFLHYTEITTCIFVIEICIYSILWDFGPTFPDFTCRLPSTQNWRYCQITASISNLI